MLGAGLSAFEDGNPKNDAENKQSRKTTRPEDLIKDLLRDALKPKKGDSDNEN